MIADIDESAPAFDVNLRRGDVILAVDGKDVNNEDAFEAALANVTPGSAVNVKVRRQGRTMEGRVPTETRPGP
jgi:S1-C subfamily serine protease